MPGGFFSRRANPKAGARMGTATLFRNVYNRSGSRILNGAPEVAAAKTRHAHSLVAAAWQADPGAVLRILSTPCRYRPGTIDKLIILQWRASLQIDLHVPGDCSNRDDCPEELRGFPETRTDQVACGTCV